MNILHRKKLFVNCLFYYTSMICVCSMNFLSSSTSLYQIIRFYCLNYSNLRTELLKVICNSCNILICLNFFGENINRNNSGYTNEILILF